MLNQPPALSLREMAMLKIAVAVCNDPEVRHLVKEYGSSAFAFPCRETHLFLSKEPASYEGKAHALRIDECRAEALMRTCASVDLIVHIEPKDEYTGEPLIDLLPSQKWEKLVVSKLFSILESPLLQKELFTLVRLISYEIDKWFKDHNDIIHCNSEIQYSFQWKSQGKIDREETAKILITNETLRVSERYGLACYYYLEEEAFYLWNRMTNAEKKRFYEGAIFIPFWFVNKWERQERTVPWSYFAWVYVHNPLGLRNIFPKLKGSQKLEFLRSILFRRSIDYEDMLFCLSEIDVSEHEDVFKACSAQVLECLLNWPLQSEFINVSNHLLPYITEKDFRDLLESIIYSRIMVGFKDYDYVRLLQEFWAVSPSHFKESVKEDGIYKPLMFAVNYDLEQPFPSEQFFDYYEEEDLNFVFCGVKYCLFKRENSFPSGMDWKHGTLAELYKGCKRIQDATTLLHLSVVASDDAQLSFSIPDAQLSQMVDASNFAVDAELQ
ncbi:uncharacterized protein NPIL_519701 [Nephila pilipes]|uniref:Uncharacterized protein n=1 Tax=Nephila pilipes TaxID=299642 RepID=A0A8X6NNB0_NEPPI|nr:uncharacterized protein NPIL_519701 [Nephila pilipes]